MKKKCFLGLLVLTLILGMALIGCASTGKDASTTYRGADLAGNEYSFTVFHSSWSASPRSGCKLGIKRSGEQEVIVSSTISKIQGLTYNLTGNANVSLTIEDDKISSIVGEVKLPNKTSFIVRTFNTVHLRACRFTDEAGNHGENYGSWSSIKLIDLYPAGYDRLIPPGSDDYIDLRISGILDKKLDRVIIDFQYFLVSPQLYPNHKTYVGGSKWSDGNFTKIGPGYFSEVIRVRRTLNRPISELPPGELEIQLVHVLSNINAKGIAYGIFDSGERIPKNIPDGSIMATIRNFKIEPIIP